LQIKSMQNQVLSTDFYYFISGTDLQKSDS